MTERVTIARPYAKAAFAEAIKTQRLAPWSDGLSVAAAVSADERVKPLFGNPHVSPAQLAELISGIGGASIDAEMGRFLAVLAENGRLPLLPEIASPDIVQPSDPALKAALDHAFEEPPDPPLRRTKAVVVVHDGRVIAESVAWSFLSMRIIRQQFPASG